MSLNPPRPERSPAQAGKGIAVMVKYIENATRNLFTMEFVILFGVDVLAILSAAYWARSVAYAEGTIFIGFYNFRLLVISPIFANLPLYAVCKTVKDHLQIGPRVNGNANLIRIGVATYLLIACALALQLHLPL